MEGGGEVEATQDSRIKFCSYCGQEFELNKALYDLKTENCNKSNKSRSQQEKRSMKNATAVERVYQCDICGKTFATGQALGGHKTCHRKKDLLEGKIVQAKIEQGSCSKVREYVTKTMLPGTLPEQVHLSEEAHPKKMLNFDLNIPYQE
ncbi:hypothetical protein HRI_004961400 [Hibiscus trionum]|uniref:C2H2-type domain-containing protein n=1 Tax=Hibiscus trionum TaxID=183268 RepID=A0A9W7JD53_HIBTR|nr:hypothetical protein HRI_004961400 [Hibiscus trionum]